MIDAGQNDDGAAGSAAGVVLDEGFNPVARRVRVARRAVAPRRKPESEVVLEGISHLRAMPQAWAHKVHGGAHGQSGEPDVDAVVRGRAVKLEAKAMGKRPETVQINSMLRWQKAGALVGWFRNNDEIDALLDHLDDPHYETDLSLPGCACSRHREGGSR